MEIKTATWILWFLELREASIWKDKDSAELREASIWKYKDSAKAPARSMGQVAASSYFPKW